MKLMNKGLLISPLAIFCFSSALAGGPDMPPSGLNDHWYLGVLGGLAINIAKSEAFYQNNTTNTSQSFNTSGYDPSGVLGLEGGYAWNVNHNNHIGLSANINYNSGDITETWHIDSNIATSDAMDLKDEIKPRWQYNFLLNLIHDLGNSFSIGINAGFSLLETKTFLTVTDVGAATGGSQAAPGNHSKEDYLAGGVLGLQTIFYLSRNSSLDFNFNYYVYSSKNLPEIGSIDTGATDSLSKRKFHLSMPVLALKYTYHF